MEFINKIIDQNNGVIVYGDWGLGIGDWPIPNPQSQLINQHMSQIFLRKYKTQKINN